MTMTETATAAPSEIFVTPKAIQKIRQTFEKQGVEGYLRLGILGGGCSGLSYQFKFETKTRPTDKVFDYDGVKVIVDPKSFLYLSGLTLDYKESLMQSGFVFDNPHATKSCGCGTSFAG
jgi:iron-sulfur cluster assembly protein